MTDAKRDNNSIVTLIGVSSADGITPVPVWVDPVTHRMLVSATGGTTPGGSNTQVQYNNNTAFGGITGATTDGTTLTLVAPVLGAALATSINGLVISTTTGTFALTNAKTLTVSNTMTLQATDSAVIAFGAGGTVAYVANKLSVFAATSSAELAGVINDETGSGLLVFATNPTLSGLTMADATNMVFNATTGTKIGTATTQKLAFYNSTPIVQPTGSLKTALSNLGLVASPTLAASELSDGVTGTGNLVATTNPTIVKPVINARNQTAQTYSPTAAGTATLDLSLGDQHYITMPAGNITIALSNDTNNQVFIVSILQDGTGSRTVTWFTTIRWAGGTPPTLTTTASKRDTFGFIRTGSGTYDGFIVGQNA